MVSLVLLGVGTSRWTFHQEVVSNNRIEQERKLKRGIRLPPIAPLLLLLNSLPLCKRLSNV